MSFGNSTVKTGRPHRARVLMLGVMAITCGRADLVNAAAIAHPLPQVEHRQDNSGRSSFGDESSQWVVSDATANPTEPAKIYVNPRQGDDQMGNGRPDRPFQTITRALDRARPNTIVILAPGIYSEASGEQFPIQLQAGVTVYGQPEQWGEGIEIVGGGWLMTPTAGEQSVAILGFDGAGLSGVTVRNPDGSAIWVAGGTPWIVGNTIVDNARHGIVAHDGTPYILNNRFDDNDGSDLEFSNRATPQLQDNQLDRRNDQAVGYFAIETEPTIAVTNSAAALPDTASSLPPARRLSPSPQAQPQPRPQTRTPNPAQTQTQTQTPTSEIVAWEGEPSFPPIVTPSDSFARRVPERLDASIAQTLPIDPDLMLSSHNRVNSVRSLDTPNVVNSDRGAVPAARASTPRSMTPDTEARSNPPSLPVTTSVRRLPAAPNVPTVSPSVETVETIETAVRPEETATIGTSVADRPVSAASPAPILAWGAPTETNTTPSTTRSTTRNPNHAAIASQPVAPPTLLRWDALDRPNPIASNELPPPIVNPAATASPASIARPETIVIASEASSPSEISRSPVPIRASIEPLDRANLPFAYAPSNITPTWPQPRPASIPGLIPLPVPDPNPPIGEGGPLPPPPSVTANLGDVPSSFSPAPARSSVRYRVLIDASVGVDRVQAIAVGAFTTQIDGREAIQAGAFSDRWRADQLVEDLQAEGLTAWVDEF